MSSDSKLVILYAEDDLDDYDALKAALDQITDKVELLWAKNGEEAIRLIEDDKAPTPCLIVLDLNMPVMTGKEVLQWLKNSEKYADLPVMIFTTSSREDDVKLCQRYNCTFFRKPTLYRDLLHIGQTMLQMCDTTTRS